MAKKQIKKVKMRYEEEMLAMEMVDGNFLLETGGIAYPNQIKESRQTRVSPAIREIFNEMYGKYQEKKKAEKKRDEAFAAIRELQKDFYNMPAAFQKAKGFLPYDDFVKEFYAQLPERIQREMEKYDYVIQSSRYSGNTKYIRISREEDIQKYYHGPLVYMEYDGTFMMVDDVEKYPDYKKYIRRCSSPLSVKAKLDEDLYLGDKQWLVYAGEYKIPIKKSMTKEYAKELAKNFAK